MIFFSNKFHSSKAQKRSKSRTFIKVIIIVSVVSQLLRRWQNIFLTVFATNMFVCNGKIIGTRKEYHYNTRLGEIPRISFGYQFVTFLVGFSAFR